MPKPNHPSPYWIGLQDALPARDGYTVYLSWKYATPSFPSYIVGYNIYFSTNIDDVFTEGAKYFTEELSLYIQRFVPGDVWYFAIRAMEYSPTDLLYTGFTPSPNANGAYVYPESMLTENIDGYQLEIPLVDVSGFPTRGIIQAGIELIKYSTIDYGNNIIFADIDGRGYYNTTANIHQIDGYDGYQYRSPIIKYWVGFEDLNTIVVEAEPRIEYPEFPYVESDGYKQVIKDILTTDLGGSDSSNIDFNTYDYSGYHQTNIIDYFSGHCIGSYAGGQYGCADGYMLRGLNLQEQNNQRLDMMLDVTGEPVVLLRRLWTGLRCKCFRMNQENPEGRCGTCFVPDTLVRTISGYKKIQDIEKDELILTSDGYFNPVKRAIKTYYNGNIMSILSSINTKPLLVTPEHPFLTVNGSHKVKRGCGPKCNNYINMGDGNCGALDVRQLPSGNWHARVQVNGTRGKGRVVLGTFKTKELAEQAIICYKKENIIQGHCLQWNNADTLTNKSWLVSKAPKMYLDLNEIYIPKQHLKQTKLGLIRKGIDKFDVTEDFLWMCGLYIAEGSCGTRTVNFSLHAKEIVFQNRIKIFFEKFGYHVKINKQKGNGTNVVVYSTTLANWFPEFFGKKCYNKKIPEEFMYLPNNKIKALISGIYDGDGSKTLHAITQTSEILALQLVELLHKLGEKPLLRTYQSSILTPIGNRRRLAYCVNWAEDTFDKNNRKNRWKFNDELLTKVRKTNIQQYDGYVYNLEVENNPTYVVNGIVVHNCFSTGFVGGYEQYYNPKRFDGRIMMRFDPTVDDLTPKPHGLQENFVPNCWTLVVPAIKDRDVLIRFNEDGTEEFRYEVINVTRNKLLFSLSGSQKMQVYRLDKSDIIYQWRAIRSTADTPIKVNTTLGTLRGYGPHLHVVTINENILNLSEINSTTGITASHSHPIINGTVLEVMGHTHSIIF